jgi:hypothetical protein
VRGVEYGVRPRPVEKRSAFFAGLPGAAGGNGERRGSNLPGNQIISPLAANLIRLMEEAREQVLRRGSTEFYPPFWMYDKILEIVNDYSPHWRSRVQTEDFKRFAQKVGKNIEDINLRPELSDEELDQRQHFFSAIQTAYGIAAYPHFTPRQKNRFREILREDIRELNIGNVMLSEQQRQVLTQIAAATGTPIDPDQETYHYHTVLRQPDITEQEMREDPRYGTW